MNKSKLFVFMMLGMSCLLQSCKSEIDELQQENSTSKDSPNFESERRLKYSSNAVDESINGDFEVKDGILHFKNFASYQKVRDSFVNLQMPERAAFADEQGFESRLSLTYKTIEQLRNSKSKDEYESLLKQNKDLVFLDESTNAVMSRISDDCAASIINKDGLVYIGKILYKFTNGLEYIVFDGDKTRLSNIKNGKIGESLEVAILNTKPAQTNNKNARVCTYMGRYEKATNSNNRWGKLEYKVDGLTYYYEPNNNPSNPWRGEAHSYVKGDALEPGIFGGQFAYSTWHHLFVSFKLQLIKNGSILATTNVQGDKLEVSMGADFHNYVSAYRPTSEALDIVINDQNSFSPPFVAGQNKYNHADLGPNQWLYPSDCHYYPLQW